MSASDFALLWTEHTYALDGKIMGRQSAGAGLLRAIAARRPAKLVCATPTRADAESCARAMARAGAPDCRIEWSPFWGDGGALRTAGALYRPDPNVAREAWRRAARGAKAYSLMGVTHTICTSVAQRAIADLVTAPVEPWDAVICTSAVARAAVREISNAQAEHLRRRLGAATFTEPQLPVIPLGVHTADFAIPPPERAAARERLQVGSEEVVVLYAGRLTPVKANAAPMLLALQMAAKGRPVTLVQAGVFPDPRMGEYYRAEAAQLAPSVRTVFVDGAEASAFRAAWASADVFTSLVDSFQETFGITPLEAMASGLPVVVSDWDGYKDTVRDGVDGFRVPTLALPRDRMQVFSDQYADGYVDLDRTLLQNASYVAVDVRRAADAFDRLLTDPEQRRRMGAAGRARARAEFDWSLVLERYRELAAELAAIRMAARAATDGVTTDPSARSYFTTFASYPTRTVRGGLQVRRTTGPGLDPARLSRTFSAQASAAAPPPPLLQAVFEASGGGGWTRVSAVAARLKSHAFKDVEAAVIWLAKFDLLEVQ